MLHVQCTLCCMCAHYVTCVHIVLHVQFVWCNVLDVRFVCCTLCYMCGVTCVTCVVLGVTCVIS